MGAYFEAVVAVAEPEQSLMVPTLPKEFYKAAIFPHARPSTVVRGCLLRVPASSGDFSQ